jgi:general secretion pathway protein D
VRVSEFFSKRFWSAGLIFVVAAGQTIAVAQAQAPQQPATASQSAQGGTERVQTWLRDAEQAISQGKMDLAGRYLEVATAVAKQPGQDPAAMQQIEALKQKLGPAAAAPAAAPAAPVAAAMPASPAMQSLLQARKALASGDMAAANRHMNEAQKLGGEFSAWGDSPAKVGEMIKRQSELVEMSKTGDANQFNQQAARFLMEQADQMLVHKDWTGAEQLLGQAAKFPVDFKSMGMDPDAMRMKISVARGDAMPAPKTAAAPMKMSEDSRMADCLKLMSEAQLACDQGRWEDAAALVSKAKAMNVPDSAFGTNQIRPWQMELTVQKAMTTRGATPAVAPAGFQGNAAGGVSNAGYVPEQDQTKVAQVSATDAKPQETEEIDLSALNDTEQALFRQLHGSVFKTRAEAERVISKDPQAALSKMMELRGEVSASALSETNKGPLLTIVDRDIQEMQRYIQQNLPDIQNQQANTERLEQVELTREQRYQVEKQIQKLVEDFNRLLDQQRYAEAEQVARQAAELDPNSEVAALLFEKAKMSARMGELNALADAKESNIQKAIGRDMEELGTPMDSAVPMQFGDAEMWNRRTQQRLKALGDRQYNSETERTIWSALKNTKVQGDFRGPLSEAVEQLAQQGGVNIVFDQLALAAESVDASRPVDVPIREPITLQSALNVVLGSVGLVFVVEDEVIKVTSKSAQRKNVQPKTYYVGDLVTPITPQQGPTQMNFITPNSSMNTQNSVLAQNMSPQQPNQPLNTAAMAQQLPGGLSPAAAWGWGGRNDYNNGPQTGTPVYNTMGAPSLGGVTEADFEPLINLIQSTIAPDEWADTGNGDGTIQPFVPNLSLIVSQTQDVQDQIQDLLKRLRELNDVQIVVEVRFITLRDTFFERIGVDFDFNINDNSGLTPPIGDVVSPSSVVGLDPRGQPTADLDLQFKQGSFTSAVPTFGGFDANTAANFGFAILSDIEVFFLIQAAKGDQRTNISQAPTVTMFNGQSASVQDIQTRPFVTSVIPVVGDFAVAHQPVISIMPDGTTLNVQAVASDDRRFIRMSLVPFFSTITDVKTFTFDGRRRVRRTSDNLLQDLLNQGTGNGNNNNQDADGTEIETESEGVTIQQPVLASTTVQTVVSVPDGGTVLLGGIKRMQEGRVERGVPMLSNIPYINRLFKNVAVGRETSNIMMMVTPRIIIQEEEEQAQVGPVGN